MITKPEVEELIAAAETYKGTIFTRVRLVCMSWLDCRALVAHQRELLMMQETRIDELIERLGTLREHVHKLDDARRQSPTARDSLQTEHPSASTLLALPR